MTIAKRLGLASVVLISVGASAGYYATAMAMRGYEVDTRALQYIVPGFVAAMSAVMLVLFWRNVHRAVGTIRGQIEQMIRERKIGLIMVQGGDELAQITQPVNRLLAVFREDLNQLRAENRELQIQSHIAEAEKKHTEAIVFSISDAVVVTNRFDELILANAAAERLLSLKLAHSLRKNIDQVIQDGTLVRLIRETRSGGRSFTRKVVEHSIDQKGQPRTYSVTLSCVMRGVEGSERDSSRSEPLPNPDASGLGSPPQGEVSGVVAVLHDVTREKEIAQMKTDFVSNVSHELRTPLSSIKGYVEMLIDGEAQDDKTRREFYEIIAGEAERLNRLIENILNISRIEAGVVRAAREPLSLTEVCRQVLDVLAPQARVKHITLVDKLAPVYHQVEADRDMMYQAILNLAGNALKYTPEGGKVTVAASVDERRGVAVVEVSDTGVGIGPEDIPRIFDKFYRVKTHTKMAKGTGLGLTLVKHIVETVHEGKLSVTSEVGKGSTFSFELPVLR